MILLHESAYDTDTVCRLKDQMDDRGGWREREREREREGAGRLCNQYDLMMMIVLYKDGVGTG